MDKQGRLTKWDEWRVGELYRWKKGGQCGTPMRCAEVNRREGFIRFGRDGSDAIHRCFNWERRFVHVPNAG